MARDGLRLDKAPDDGTYEWTNPHTGEIITVPNGIDPGWAYNPGKVASNPFSPVSFSDYLAGTLLTALRRAA